MPILDPSLMAALAKNKDPLEYKSKAFIIYLIKEASKHLNRNMETNLAVIQFKQDLQAGLEFVNFYFDSNLTEEDIKSTNIYDILYSKININYKAEQFKYDSLGTYYLYGSDLHFFQPCIEFDFRSWYLTSTKVAILVVHYIDPIKHKENFSTISIEMDLMTACGFSIVLVYTGLNIQRIVSGWAFDDLEWHQLAEIHFVLDVYKDNEHFPYHLPFFFSFLKRSIDKFSCHFYLYTQFFNDISEKAVKKFKKLKRKSFFHPFLFSLPVFDSIKTDFNLIQSNHFVYCKNGFNSDLIFVRMQNVPLYSSEDEDADFTPAKVSGFKTAYMLYDDFINWNNKRVEVLFNDEESSTDFVSMFVDFDDLHLIKIGSYVDDTLLLTKTHEETLNSVDRILEGQFSKFEKNDEFKKENLFVFFKDNKILKFLTYVSYAYSKHEIKKNARFSMHKNQIFTAFEACKIFLRKNNENSGVIYQVETGEGKSCIICLIASLLALMKKTVHIASSNITLANRDYHESYEFFKNLGLKSAVLLHYNELPVDLSFQDNQEDENQNKNGTNKSGTKKEDTNKSGTKKEDTNKSSTKKEETNKNGTKKDGTDKSGTKKDVTNKSVTNKNGTNKSGTKKEDTNKNGTKKDGTDKSGTKKDVTNKSGTKKEDIDKSGTNIDGTNNDNGRDGIDGIDNNNEFTFNPNYFPKEFFHKKLFNNSSNMNFSVCGINNDNEITDNKANIIFSTFVNFESLYLKLMEVYPGQASHFFHECSLIIDEADSILIDELTNGTILSRSMKTNGSEVLKFVYTCYTENKEVEEVYNEVKKEFPKCEDLKIEDIKDMYSQIELVNREEFQNGKKYSIETKEIKEKLSLKSIIEKSKEIFDDTKGKLIEGVKSIPKKKKAKDDFDDNEIRRKSKKRSKTKSEKVISKNKFKRKTITLKEIVPFDYDHKGVLEPNKEFSGFVQQFIAIKEMFNNNEENQNMIIKDVSMNYLYVSHPIFVKLYGGVVGLTGTIGNRYDKELLKEQYKLTTKKIPRNKPNLRIEYPMILCHGINERNLKIASEVIKLHKKDIPVLVIFQDLNEISALHNLLSNDIKNINIFDGKNEKIKPDHIAGLKGAVSLGTNVCGRGTDIKNPVKPLHVIITYFTSNTRVMMQAFGRTARQGQEGSVRIICVQDQFISPIKIFNKIQIVSILDDFKFKNDLQQSFINRFKSKREWIFTGLIKTQKFTDDQIKLLRKTNININRINAFNFEFPICMSIQTFLLIQAQKIFSLYNCPNCKYTWILFQKYVREMILQSWSLFIEKAEKTYYESKIQIKYIDYLKSECDKLYDSLLVYLFESNNSLDYEIVPTFMHIFNIIKDKYEDKIMNLFPKSLIKFKKEAPYERQRFVSFTIGFKPYSLIDESGARINVIDGNQQEQTFIQDPELKYIKKKPHHHFSILSITEKIDDLFNLICQKINDVLGSKIGLKFFMRRTLGGCEFGICYDFNIENQDSEILRDLNCIVDKDPLLLFTVTVKSRIPILAGILIIGLVYIASISKTISEWIMAFPVKLSKELVVKTVKTVAQLVINHEIEKFCGAVISFLQKQVEKQIDQLKNNGSKYANIFLTLLTIAAPVDFSNCGETIGHLFEGKNIGFKSKFAGGIVEGLPVASFLKIGFLVMLCFATFMINFYEHRQSIKYSTEKAAEDFDEEQNAQLALNQNEDYIQCACQPIEKIKVTFITDNE